MSELKIADRLLDWYDRNRRVLPWRVRPEPYQVWVSEIMLQQTRVETVVPYFERWMERFPTLADLAAASQQEVLAAWEGLGYYSRARNLHRAARVVLDTYQGVLPADPRELRKLPGIGRYTAGAIASIAFGLDEPVLDGNIRRVYTRLFDVCEPARSPQGERILWKYAGAHLAKGRAGDFNQALMDLGAMVCTPRSPGCDRCPLADLCQARALGVQEQRPVRAPRTVAPHHTVTAGVIQHDSQVLIAQRPQDGLLGGLWEFPGGKLQPGEDLEACLRREIDEELGVEVRVHGQLGVFRHAFSHFRVILHGFHCSLVAGQPRPLQVHALRWVSLSELGEFPMGKLDRQISKRLVASRLD